MAASPFAPDPDASGRFSLVSITYDCRGVLRRSVLDGCLCVVLTLGAAIAWSIHSLAAMPTGACQPEHADRSMPTGPEYAGRRMPTGPEYAGRGMLAGACRSALHSASAPPFPSQAPNLACSLACTHVCTRTCVCTYVYDCVHAYARSRTRTEAVVGTCCRWTAC